MIHLVQPMPGDTVSGGYRYGREIEKRLERDGTGCVTSLDDLDPRTLSPSDVLVVDSLYLSQNIAPGLLEFPGRKCLLLHYLPSRQRLLNDGHRKRRIRLEAQWLGWAERLLVPSFRFATKLPDVARRTKEVHVTTPGMSRAFRAPIPSLREPREGEALCIVTVDAISSDKNVGATLDALRELDSHEFVWHIAGDLDRERDYGDAFLEAVERAGLSSCVRRHEKLSPASVARLLDKGHLYVTASREESYGMATAEAVARGLPVVGFDVGCTSKWVVPGANGHVVALGQEEEFRNTLLDLAANRRLLYKLAQGARAAAERIQFPSWDDTYAAFQLATGVETPANAVARR